MVLMITVLISLLVHIGKAVGSISGAVYSDMSRFSHFIHGIRPIVY